MSILDRPPSPPSAMAPQGIEHDLSDPAAGAAWSIISYIFSGILFWGVLGWLVDRWLFDPAGDVSVFLPIGVIVGTAAGGYLGYMRYLQVTNAYESQRLTADGRVA